VQGKLEVSESDWRRKMGAYKGRWQCGKTTGGIRRSAGSVKWRLAASEVCWWRQRFAGGMKGRLAASEVGYQYEREAGRMKGRWASLRGRCERGNVSCDMLNSRVYAKFAFRSFITYANNHGHDTPGTSKSPPTL
jgi:hypothetical protein